jgi:hypothetical protein
MTDRSPPIEFEDWQDSVSLVLSRTIAQLETPGRERDFAEAERSQRERLDGVMLTLQRMRALPASDPAEGFATATHQMMELAEAARVAVLDESWDLGEWIYPVLWESLVELDFPEDDQPPPIEASIAARLAAAHDLEALVNRFDLSRSRGRTMRPVAPGLGGELAEQARIESVRLAAASVNAGLAAGRR